ncbi:MAG TPA: SDR family NAD(P)-dependent oxidoreductase [Solirubrobacteraceae bacterium]|nr:SDR family NAD(P)-dependent oxidoreductase [Solirubrobacteraceae bacterium]
MNVAGRTVLLTGATGGLGNAIARALGSRGAKLLLSGRRADVLEPLAEELGGRALAADLTDRAAVDRLAAEAGNVDILVANAGLPADGPVLDYTVEQLDRALEVNLRAPLVLARMLSEPMVARGEGHIVFMSSLSGKVATGNAAVYAATKFGLRGFAWGLRHDLRDAGVGVSVITPGIIRDAGFFADAGVAAPFGSARRTAGDVGDAVVGAIERNRAEIVVGSVGEKVWGALGALTPSTLAYVNRRFGGNDVAGALGASEAHRSKR